MGVGEVCEVRKEMSARGKRLGEERGSMTVRRGEAGGACEQE